ncbi:DUF7718 family protein [Thermus scotoductus]|uniref:DUF7718 family protein n=1 Tax=Thermus scotoductus TaxID=37636 RepID=UPI003F51308F
MGSQQREFPFALDRRLRLTLRVERGKLVAWAVQLEWFDAEEGRWVWVARYDTAGGRPHRDRNRLGGTGKGMRPWKRKRHGFACRNSTGGSTGFSWT